MVCIYCEGSTRVSNSRHQKNTNHVWRRRCCSDCGAVFTTTEQVNLEAALRVRYPNDILQPFDQNKLLVSIYECCKHRTHALTDAAGLTATILTKLSQAAEGAVIQRADIILTAATVLERFDVVAATMYRAFHRS